MSIQTPAIQGVPGGGLNPSIIYEDLATSMTSNIFNGTSFTSSLPDSQPITYPELPSLSLVSTISPVLQEHQKNLQEHQKNFPASQNYNPREFRNLYNKGVSYQLRELVSSQREFSDSELATLQSYCLDCMNGFHPQYFNNNHPIHREICNLCQKLLIKYNGLTLDTKISHFESAIAELTRLSCISLTTDAKFELVEIALRHHFFLGLLEGEKTQIKTFFEHHHLLPNNLASREIALLDLLTNKAFYCSPYQYVAPSLLEGIAPTLIQNCIAKTTSIGLPLDKALASYENLIANELSTQNLTNPSQCSSMIEAGIRDSLTRSILSKLATQYKQQFQKTGLIDQQQMQADFGALGQFNSGNGKFALSVNPKIQLLIEIFDLRLNESTPFVSVKAQVTQQKDETLAQLQASTVQRTGLWKAFDFSQSSREQTAQKNRNAIETLAQNKLNTLEWAERAWQQDLYPILTTTPILSAPTSDKEVVLIPSGEHQQPVPSLIPPPPVVVVPPQQQPQNTVITAPVVVVEQAPKENKFQLASYVDTCSDIFKGTDQETWSQMPTLIKRDVLRHVTAMPSNRGKAEEIVRRIFKEKPWTMHQDIQTYNGQQLSVPRMIDPQFKAQGEEVLNFYYSTKISNFHLFLQKLHALPIEKEPNFLKYVYEIAKASNVSIPSWDHQWAQYHWRENENVLISLQALEKCLHVENS